MTNPSDSDRPKKELQTNTSMSMIELSTIIKRYMSDIDKLKADTKAKRDMFKDAFENDKDYHEKAEKAKEANRLKIAERQRILKQPPVEALSAQIRDLTAELRNSQEGLSGYLAEYQRISGTNLIEDDEGEILQIVPVYKLVRKSKYNP